METGKRSIVLYIDLVQHVRQLPLDEVGEVFLAVLNYADTGELPELSGAAGMCFSFIRAQLDRDTEKWEETRAKRIVSGRTGGIASGIARKQTEANEASASKPKQTEANEAVNVNGTVTVPVNVNVPINGTVKKEKKAPVRFSPPNLDDIQVYIIDNGYIDVDAERFLAYYAASDWHDKDGKPVKNWKQKVISWSGRGSTTKKGVVQNGNSTEKDYSAIPGGYSGI